MRLIDADDYCANVCLCFAQNCDKENCPIQKAPTIDPESLRPQGEWEAYPSDQYRRCSHCKTEWEKEKIPRIANYCPNCGAKMKGERP